MKGFASRGLPVWAWALWGGFALAVLTPAGDLQAQQRPGGKPVVAIVPDRSDRVAPVADLLFAELSKSPRMDLVERAELKKIRDEQELQLSFGALGGEARRRLGSLLRADFLVLLRLTGDAKSPALEIVIADTRFGYRLGKQLRKWDPKQAEPAARAVGNYLNAALDRFSGGVKFAVAVPPFFSRNLTHRFDHLQAALGRVAELEAARRPGCAVVELAEAKAIAKELATGSGNDRVRRPLPYYIVGEFRHETLKGDSPVTVTLRLQRGEQRLAESSSQKLNSSAAAKFVRETASGFMTRINSTTKPPSTDPAKELKALLMRAKGFLEVGGLAESAALYEAALLLAPDDIDALDGAVESYVRMVQLPLSQRSPGKRNEAEWEAWDQLRKREMGAKAYQAIRAGEHLTELVRLKKYDRFWTMRARVESVWGSARLMTRNGRFEGLDEELALLEQARRDFLLYGFPHTWREKGWSDQEKRREYTYWWFHLVTLIGEPAMRGFPDKDWFDYRLKLFQAVYKGKSRWYDRWVVLPQGCIDGSLKHRYGAEAVEQYIKLHDAFVEQFKRVCDDPKGLAMSLDYARLRREYPDRNGQPDMVVLMELIWMYRQCEAMEIWEGMRALETFLEMTAGRYSVTVPRFKSSTRGPYRPPPPKAGDELRVGRLTFTPVKLHFTGVNAAEVGSANVPTSGLVQCSPGIDVLWSSASIAVMKEKGRAVEIFRDTKTRISEVCWDGKWLWAGTLTGRILLIDPVKGSVRTIGEAEGVPGSGVAMVICPLGRPGRICAVGAIPPHARAWCAIVTAEGKVNVFHEARRIAKKKDDAGADCAFKPCWVFPITSADGKSIDRLLLSREGLNVRSTSEHYHVNNYAMAQHPLVIDPNRLTVEPLKATMALGLGRLHRWDVVQVGEFLFFGTTAVKVTDMNYQIGVATRGGEAGVRHHGTAPGTFKLNGKLYIPAETFVPWMQVDPKTVIGEILAEGHKLPKSGSYTYFPSWHYGILGLNHGSRGPHYEVTVHEKSPPKNEGGADESSDKGKSSSRAHE